MSCTGAIPPRSIGAALGLSIMLWKRINLYYGTLLAGLLGWAGA